MHVLYGVQSNASRPLCLASWLQSFFVSHLQSTAAELLVQICVALRKICLGLPLKLTVSCHAILLALSTVPSYPLQDKEHLQSQEEQLNRQMQELQAAKQEVQGLQQSLQAAQQEVQAAQSAQQAGEASHHVELDQLQQDLVLSQQQLAHELSKRQRANPRSSSRAASHGPSEDVLPARYVCELCFALLIIPCDDHMSFLSSSKPHLMFGLLLLMVADSATTIIHTNPA